MTLRDITRNQTMVLSQQGKSAVIGKCEAGGRKRKKLLATVETKQHEQYCYK